MFQLVGDGVRVFNPRDDGHVVRRGRRAREVRRPAGAGGGRARADGRRGRQHQGRSRHRRQGRARADHRVRVARRAAGARRRGAAEEVPRGAAGPRRPRAPEPGAGAHPARRAGRLRHRGAPLPRAEAGGVLRAVRRTRVPVADERVRADGRSHGRADYAIVETIEAVRALAAELRAARRFALRTITAAAPAVQADLVGIAVSVGSAAGALRSAGPPRAGRGTSTRPPRNRRGAEGRVRGSGDREGRPRPEARGDGAGALRRDAARPRVRHDARQLPARRDPVRAPARGGRARADRVQGDRPRRMSAGAARRRAGSRTCRRRPSSTSPASARTWRWQLEQSLAPALASERLDGVYRDLELPLVPVLAEIERAGVKVDCGVLGRLSERLERELAGAAARDLRAGGRSFNINSPRQLAEVLFDKLKLPAGKKTGKTRRGLDRVGRARGAGADARPAAAGPRVAKRPEAQGDLRRRAAAAREPGDGTRAHVVQPGGRGHRAAEQQRPEPAEHPDPHASSAARSARRSSPSRAAC